MSNLLVVNQLLSQVTEDELYGKIVHAMRDTELEEALAEETRAEGLKILQAEATRRGMQDATHDKLSPEQEAALQEAISKLQTEMEPSKRHSYVRAVGNFLLKYLNANPDSADKILDPEKTITKSLAAMKTEAKKNQVDGCAVLTDAEGFAVVLDYFGIEHNGQPSALPGNRVLQQFVTQPAAAKENITFDVKLEDLL